MIRIFLIKSIILLLLLLGCKSPHDYKPENGDIIFQTSRSSQSMAIQKATNSKYSHMGIIFIREGKPFVYEAVEPVKLTAFDDWVSRGSGKHFTVKRLSSAKQVLTPNAINKMLKIGKNLEGKHYDLYFEWSDDRIYCSELVWKIYKRALNIEVGKLQIMSDFDLSDPLVQSKIRERFGDSLPKNETVISPSSIFESPLLVKVYEN
ncbi:MAG: YiiX family permuted papain-like enzyme [Deltaproteobacteria bacterium]|nr:YiiX family permuted papain-like enzyme [Deltaproteobacteria bacterium]